MKVIGESADGYVITATKDEIANLQGMYSRYDSNFKIKVGDDINVEEFYKMAREACSIRQRRDELITAANHIDSAIRIIDFVTKASGSLED